MDSSIFDLKDFGYVVITIKDVMLAQGISRTKLSKQTGIAYNSIKRYYSSAPITSIDLTNLAKICYVLNCQVSDVLQYRRPKEARE